MNDPTAQSLEGRTCYIPQICPATARLFAAALRGVGIDAVATPDTTLNSIERALRHTSGDECLPQHAVLGDFLGILDESGKPPSQLAFFLPTSSGPCRYGQYGDLTRKIFSERGAEEVTILSPTFDNGYQGMGKAGPKAMRYLWWGLVCADILRSLLHCTRPYEKGAGQSDAIFKRCLSLLEELLSDPALTARRKFNVLMEKLMVCRSLFRDIEVNPAGGRPLIGVLGEIYCRLNPFSNAEVVRSIEAQGGEAWVTGFCEWVLYANTWEMIELKAAGRRFSARMLQAWLSDAIQRRDEHTLKAPFARELGHRPEPRRVSDILRLAAPYLTPRAGLGEMTLSIGRAAYLHGCDVHGILDVSPFSCMNGIVSQALYPKLSADHEQIPIRNLYVEGPNKRHDEELEIFMELVANYRARTKRTTPPT